MARDTDRYVKPRQDGISDAARFTASRREFLRQTALAGSGFAGMALRPKTAAAAALSPDARRTRSLPASIQNTPVPPAMLRLNPHSLIQSNIGDRQHGNFEAVILDAGGLVHYFRDNSTVSPPWQRGQIISTRATGPACIIQSNFGGGQHGNFEVVVREGNDLVHYFHDNSNVNLPWGRGQIISTAASGPGCLIQSNFGGVHGNFEVVVQEGSNLVHYFHDNSNVSLPWGRGQVITRAATGPGCLIQSNFGSGQHGNFEVAVLEGDHLVHYFHDNSDVTLPWSRGQIISASATGPGAIIQSNFGSGQHGNFEVIVPEGNNLVHYFHDNSKEVLPWSRGQIVSTAATGPGCLIQSNFGGAHGNFEVLAQECFDAVVHYWHNNADATFPWRRSNVLLAQTVAPETLGAQKLYQLTGDWDYERNQPTLSQSGQYGIYDTDLGSSFEHKGRIYFLFGDTNRKSTGPPPNAEALDSTAFTTDRDPARGVRLVFNRPPPLVPGITQLGLDVPLEGISVDDQMYVYFSTDSTDDRPMPRSVLARSRDDGLNFDLLYNLSTDKFINVSVQRVLNEAVPGVPERVGGGLLIWASGRYRASDVHLGYMPLNGRHDIENPAGLRYLAGFSSTTVTWSRSEADAVPLFCAGCVGELSVRWNPFLKRWVMMHNSDNPRGIILRVAPAPWGPWSDPRLVFEPGVHGGYGHFMHIKDGAGSSDPGRGSEWGGEYGPYQIASYTTGVPDQYCVIYFTMSTWNPYQAVLMRVVIGTDGRTLEPSSHA